MIHIYMIYIIYIMIYIYTQYVHIYMIYEEEHYYGFVHFLEPEGFQEAMRLSAEELMLRGQRLKAP